MMTNGAGERIYSAKSALWVGAASTLFFAAPPVLIWLFGNPLGWWWFILFFFGFAVMSIAWILWYFNQSVFLRNDRLILRTVWRRTHTIFYSNIEQCRIEAREKITIYANERQYVIRTNIVTPEGEAKLRKKLESLVKVNIADGLIIKAATGLKAGHWVAVAALFGLLAGTGLGFFPPFSPEGDTVFFYLLFGGMGIVMLVTAIIETTRRIVLKEGSFTYKRCVFAREQEIFYQNVTGYQIKPGRWGGTRHHPNSQRVIVYVDGIEKVSFPRRLEGMGILFREIEKKGKLP